MTFTEFITEMLENGVRPTDEIDYIDIRGDKGELIVSRGENMDDHKVYVEVSNDS